MSKIKDEVYDPFLPTLLISLHQEYVKEILTGQKIIEYRKSFFKDSFQAFVYTTGSAGGIQLFIKCAPLIRNNAANLAQIGQEIQNDDYAEIYGYFMPKDDGCIIPILKSCAVKKITLEQLRAVLPQIVVPQKYLFLDRPDKADLLNFLLNQECDNLIINNWDKRYALIKNILAGKNWVVKEKISLEGPKSFKAYFYWQFTR